jgi:fructose-1,6-bisphosphatase/sedoheptulose 1,7-bisphosphatase-like protein
LQLEEERQAKMQARMRKDAEKKKLEEEKRLKKEEADRLKRVGISTSQSRSLIKLKPVSIWQK